MDESRPPADPTARHAEARLRPPKGSTVVLAAVVAALAACRGVPALAGGAATATPPDGGGPASPGAVRAVLGRGADVELSWEPSPTRGVVYAIVDARGKRVGLTARTHFTVPGFGVKGERCYGVIALDPADRASRPTPAACAGPAEPGDEARPPGGEPEEPRVPDPQSFRPHVTPMTTSGALES